jgi:ABC-type sugar transport system substrate-binding protein
MTTELFIPIKFRTTIILAPSEITKDFESKNIDQDISSALKNSNIDIIFAHTDFIAKKLYNILKKNNKQNKIKIIGVDGLMEKGMGLDMVINKELTATILYPTGGKQSIKTAINILNNQNFDRENQLETIIIDSTNLEYFKKIRIKLNEQKLDRIKLNDERLEQNTISNNQKSLILNLKS